MNKRLNEAHLICREFKLTTELEVDRKILSWLKRNRGKQITMQDSLLCTILSITKEQYWLSVARLHYLGLVQFPVEIIRK